MKFRNYAPALRYGAKIYPEDTAGLMSMNDTNRYWFVDGDVTASGAGQSWEDAYKTIQEAVTAASSGDTIFIGEKTITDMTGDPTSYAETITIPVTKSALSLIGISRGRTQGGLPQIKPGGASHTWAIIVRSPGCMIASLGINGNSAAGAPINGGILLDDDNSAKSAFGTTIIGCHFKNCAGTTITDAKTGGAIDWTSAGNAWQVLIQGNRFYKNRCDICLLGTSNTVPQDVVIQNNIFSGPTASVDANLYLAGGSGMNGVVVDSNIFAHVLPSLSSGQVVRYADMTGCVGIFSNNVFGCTDTTTGFGAARASAKIPTTVGIAMNYSDGGLIVRQ